MFPETTPYRLQITACVNGKHTVIGEPDVTKDEWNNLIIENVKDGNEYHLVTVLNGQVVSRHQNSNVQVQTDLALRFNHQLYVPSPVFVRRLTYETFVGIDDQFLV